MADPICFVSYSWDTEAHRAWVRNFSAELIRNGVNILLDQWDLKPGMNLLKYMEESIIKSDFVLLICTPLYAQKANARKDGVGWENIIISGEMFNNASKATKFIPILRTGTKEDAIANYLSGKIYIDFVIDDLFHESMEKLLRHLYDSPEYKRPEKGVKPNFVDSSIYIAEKGRKNLLNQANEHLLNGVKYANRKQYNKAISEYKKALNILPEYAEPYHNIGVVYSFKGQSKKAIKMFEKAISLNPNDAVSYNSLGVEYQKNKMYSVAITKYSQAIKINPHFVLAYNNLAGVFTIIGELDRALKACKNALEINSEDILAHLNLGGIYYNKSMYQEAFMEHAEVLRIDPNNKFVYFQIGSTYLAIGEREKGCKALYKFVADPPEGFLYNVKIAKDLINKNCNNA